MTNNSNILFSKALNLLKGLIEIPSLSREEQETAALLFKFLEDNGVSAQQFGNNVYALNKYFEPGKPTLLLNSHHDTVKPDKAYTLDPFKAIEDDGKLFGLGSNDAGGSLVALIATFLNYYGAKDLAYNIIFVASAEEEISGSGGIEAVLPVLPPIDFAIVGEPTLMQMAVAEKGLMVLDCTAIGITGHAARNEGENALYKAMADINWINSYKFEKVSPFLGPVKTTVTVIETDNKAHNVVPASCKFVVDVRVNELYTFEEVIAIVQEHFQSTIQPRSFRLKSSSIAENHPLVMAGKSLGKTTYGSPTTSDKALMPFPALKMGPGNSARSHTANEFIYVNEINEAIEDYIKIINQLVYNHKP
jgi:acetylornithine deacetylase